MSSLPPAMEPNLDSMLPEPNTRISARSRRQAMDWSLVLASQDIQAVILPPDEDQSWALVVEPGEYEKAVWAIQQYRLENRGWSWRKELPGGTLEVHSGALFWCLFLALWHWIVTFALPQLRQAGEMDSVAARHGAWYRLFTPVILHSDLAHLMANATFGLVMLGLAMARFGPGVTLLATYIAGVMGNVMGLSFYTHAYRGLGASGMMMGALGLLCIQSLSLWRRNARAARYVLSGIFAGFLLFVMFGLNPSSDILAHLGGFVSGLFFGGILSLAPEAQLQKRRTNLACFGVLLGIMTLTWALALR